MNTSKIFAVDFDGTLCKDKWPEIGEPVQSMIDYCIGLRNQGHRLILWTCRTEEQTKEAVKWCNERGLFFHAVNANLPDEIVKYGNDPRKVGADYFIDDKNLSIREIIKPSVLTVNKVNILGTDYQIILEPSSSMRLKSCNGYCDFTVKEIHVNDFSEEEKEDDALLDLKFYRNKVLRHEIMHAFLYESGLYNNTKIDGDWSRNETVVDWFAIQSPKIFEVYEELGVI